MYQLKLPGIPTIIYDAITTDISGWWDHSFSDSPKTFYYELESVNDDSALLKLIVRAAGQMEEKWPDTVDQVWQHFLFERLKPYIESKKHLI